jgi:hypothetical protein
MEVLDPALKAFAPARDPPILGGFYDLPSWPKRGGLAYVLEAQR